MRPTTGAADDRAALRGIARLAFQQWRYPANVLVWMLNWSLPIALGVIAQRFFDGLTDDGGWALTTVVVALLGYLAVRLTGIFVGMPLAARVVFTSGSVVRRNMLHWILRLPGAQPVRLQTGEVVSRFRDDVQHTEEFLDGTVDFAGSVVTAGVSFVLLAAIDLRWALWAFVPIVLVFVATVALSERIRDFRRRARDHTEAVTGFLGETFGASQAVKLAGAEASVLRRFDALNDARRHAMVRDRVLTTATRELGGTSGTIALGVMLVLAATSLASDAPGALTVGEFALFAALLSRAAHASYFIARAVAELRQAGVSIRRMTDMLEGATIDELTARPTGLEVTIDLPAGRDSAPLLELRGLSHRFDQSDAGVDAVDLDVRRGELVVVTGRVGSGKTTLLQTALGLLPADAGTVRWHGVLLDDVAAAMVPPRVAYTPQVPRLLSATLRDNVLLGLDRTDDDVVEALAAAHMTTDLAAMPHGLDTMVGTRGLRLSGGQVQRTAAARMLVRRPELLVIDDVSSALDVETETMLWQGLMQGDTAALVVSHRRPALRRADRIVVLEDGEVVDVGTLAELLDRSPTFVEIWG